jgi:hypothetical protein
MYNVVVSRFRSVRVPRHVTFSMGVADSSDYASLVGRMAERGEAQDIEFYVYACDIPLCGLQDAWRLYRHEHFGVLARLGGLYRYYPIKGSCWKFLPRRLSRLGVAFQRK